MGLLSDCKPIVELAISMMAPRPIDVKKPENLEHLDERVGRCLA